MDEEKIVREIVILKENVANIKEIMATKSDIEDIKSILDKIVTGVNSIRQDHVAAIDWLQRHDKNFAAHDKIIGHNCNFELVVG